MYVYVCLSDCLSTYLSCLIYDNLIDYDRLITYLFIIIIIIILFDEWIITEYFLGEA